MSIRAGVSGEGSGAVGLCLALALLIPLVSPPVVADTPSIGQIVVSPGNPRWFSYHQLGSFFMAGPGDPEDFLYRGTLNEDGTRDGDQMELIEKLAPTGANSIYFAAVGSDAGDPTYNPFIDHVPANGLNQAVLDQWETWFAEMDRHGIVIFFIFYNDGQQIWPTGDVVGDDERAFLYEIVDRFEHHKNLIWVVAEEYDKVYTHARVAAIAAEIQAADDHGHPVAAHRLPNRSFDELADDPALDSFAAQTFGPEASQFNAHMRLLWNEAAGRYNLTLAEGRIWGSGQTARRNAWAAAMAGAYVMGYQMDIAGTPVEELEDLGRLRDFMERTDFQAMEHRNDLAAGDTVYVQAAVGKSYIAYAPQGTGALGLSDFVAGTYRLLWLDTATGQEVVQDNLSLAAGAQSWPRPAGIGQEAVVYALRLDGDNDPPVAYDRALATVETAPLTVILPFSDPDGPGPYLVSVVTPPVSGTISGIAPDLVYSADPGFVGTDSFTWIVNDGRDDSNLATATITVTANQVPVALNGQLAVEVPPLGFSLADFVQDPDGPGPHVYTVLTPPASGQLTGSGADLVYTPDPGFVGTDSFTWRVNDSLDDSNVATLTLQVRSLLLFDDFERPDSDAVGNGWVELEGNGPVVISGGELFFDAQDEPWRPLVDHGVTRQSSGLVLWSFDLDFARSGNERNYSFHMQLGRGSQMTDSPPTAQGVAVNLIWGSLSAGLATHEGFGYVVDGVVSQLATLSGPYPVRVEVDLATSTYRVEVDGQTSAAIPFDNDVEIDSVRFYAHGINGERFSSLAVDNVLVTGPADVGGANDPPVAFDSSVSTIETQPVVVTLGFSDPDGPGPHVYTIVGQPSDGALSGAPPDLTYTADPGFVGSDSFTWRVNDGELDSNLATVSLTVEANQPPAAVDAQLSASSDAPLAISLSDFVQDPDGPGPYAYTILTSPANGQLTGGGPDWTYTPDAGFVGIDSFTWKVNDGLADSGAATLTLEVQSALFADDFERPDSGVVGNGWVELEAAGPVVIAQGGLSFDAVDEPYRPLLDHLLPMQASGRLTWSFDLDFVRSGGERNYSFHMQLGLGSQMTVSPPSDQGVAVNLIWGSLTAGLATHEGLGHVVDGVVTHLARVSGPQPVTVEVDLDASTYRIEVAGQTSADVPFDDSVAIDTVRYYAHGLNRSKFSSRRVDNVLVTALADDGTNDPPLAFDSAASTLQGEPVDIALAFSDPDGPGPYVFTIVGPPAAGVLSGTPPDLTYTPDPGFAGADSFTWRVNDGELDSNLATAAITVAPNQAPIALDAGLATTPGTPVDLSLANWVDDPDGPGPYAYSILTSPAAGQLAGSGAEWTYTPDPGFAGTDSFTWSVHDGLADSNVATVTIEVVSSLLADDFERPDSDDVGNGWVELEGNGPVRIASGNLVFDGVDEAYRPLIDHPLPVQSSGLITWSFDLDFVRSGPERNYSFHLQLGLGSQMPGTPATDQGVAVNLVWGSLSAGLATHEGLGYVVDGAVTQIATVSGRQPVLVEVDLDARTYRVEVAGAVSADIPFENDVAIDTVRYYAHGLNRNNFSSRRIDNVLLD